MTESQESQEFPEFQSKIASREELSGWAREARRKTLALMEGLSHEQLLGTRVATVNPMIWHLGHISWFHERFLLRLMLGRSSLREDSDLLYDSFAVPHEIRWELDMPSLEETLGYCTGVLDNVLEQIEAEEPGEQTTYFTRLAVFHEGMHEEAMIFDRQTLNYPAPQGMGQARGNAAPERASEARAPEPGLGAGPLPGDVEVPGMKAFMLGGSPEMPFVFDNEKWAHPVDVAPFRIARAQVTNGEFAEFVEAGGYENPDYWNLWGQLWLKTDKPSHPAHWRRAAGGGWEQRTFESWGPLGQHRPVMHVNWHEARAYCEWAGRRLPSEAEWEMAASTEASPEKEPKRRFPWGEVLPDATRANMDCHYGGAIDVAGLPAGDSAHGCRQMLGNVWEWTADPFDPFPGFVLDPYREYSAPWFGYRKVLRGGSWATPSRMVRSTWRNFFLPDRLDIFSGFRTCAC